MDDVANVVSLLSADHPTSESTLYGLLKGMGWSRDQMERAVNEAQAKNEIRWVAFRGWLRGGRPE